MSDTVWVSGSSSKLENRVSVKKLYLKAQPKLGKECGQLEREASYFLPGRPAGSTITPRDPLPPTVPCYNALCEQLGENTWWWKIFTLFFTLFEEAREDT